MQSSISENALSKQLRTMQIIVFVMLAGCLSFTAIAVAVVNMRVTVVPTPNLPLITYIALGVALVDAILSFIVPKFMLPTQLRAMIQGGKLSGSSPPETSVNDSILTLYRLYQTQLIVSAAILEGAILFLVIAYMVEAQIVSLMAAAPLILLLAMKFPTLSRLERWIEEQHDHLSMERSQF